MVCCLQLAAGCAREEAKVRLEVKRSPGQELVYEQINRQTISLNNSPVTAQSSQSRGEMVQRVIDVAGDGSARIEESSTWSWTEYGVDSAYNVISTTESLSYRIAADGKISELELPEDGESSKWKAYAQSNLEQSQPTFPTEPVGKGYTWMQSVKIFMPSGEKLDASTTYKVTDLIEVDGRKCAIIDYKGNLILPFDVIESDSVTRKGVDRVDVAGTIVFDYANGYVYSRKKRQWLLLSAPKSRVLRRAPTPLTSKGNYSSGLSR